METVLITEQDFDIDVEYSALKTAGVGAVVIFAGIVRDSADNPELRAMTLEHYPGMTEKEITIITEQARARWPLQGCAYSPCWPVIARREYCLCRLCICTSKRCF